MTRPEKAAVIDALTTTLQENDNLYLADLSGLNAFQTAQLRRACFKAGVSLSLVKNTLLKKAMEASEKDFEPLYEVLQGNSALMVAEKGNAPAKVIQRFRKKQKKPLLKAAFIDTAIYTGDEHLEALVAIKSREELIGDVIASLQSPIQQLVSALRGQGEKIAGVLKTLSEKAES